MLLGVGPEGPVAGRRVAITGLGRRLRAAAWVPKRCGPGSTARHPVGERRVPDFDPERWFTAKEARQIDRFAQFSVAVAAMALDDAGELDADPGRSGVVMGTGVGGLETLETQILVFGEKGPRRVSPRLVPDDDVQCRARPPSPSAWAGTVPPRRSPPPVPPAPTASATPPGWWPRAGATSPSAGRPRRA